MKLFKLKNVVPIDKFLFRRHVLISFVAQLFFVLMSYLLINFLFTQSNSLMLSIVIFLLSNLLFFYMCSPLKIAGRFKNIYPEYEFNSLFYLMLILVPFFLLIMIAFLCLKERDDSKPLPGIFKLRYAFLAFLLLLVVQITSPICAYLTASPGLYFAIRTGHDGWNLLNYKKSLTYGDDVIQNYRNKYSKKLSSTEMILLVAINANMIFTEKSRSVASGIDKKEAAIKYGLALLNSCHSILVLMREHQLEIFDFNPLSWFYPSGPTEIFILDKVEQKIFRKGDKILLEKNILILDALEKNVLTLSPSKKEYYSMQLKQLRSSFLKMNASKVK